MPDRKICPGSSQSRDVLGMAMVQIKSTLLSMVVRSVTTMRKLCSMMALTILLLLPAICLAGVPHDLTTLSLEELMTVEVRTVSGASRFEQRIEDAQARIDVGTAEEIRRFGFRTVADILNSLGGVFVTSDRNYYYFGTRGFFRSGELNSRLMMLIDGNRLSDPVYGSSPVGHDVPLDLDLIEKVEIIRGPCSALYEDNAFFGVINIVTRKGDALPQQGELAGFIGTHGTGGARVTWVKRGKRSELLHSHSVMGSNGPQRLFYPAFNDPATNFGVAINRDWANDSDTFLSFRRGPWTFEALHGRFLKGIPTGSYGTIFNDPDASTSDSFHHLACIITGNSTANGVSTLA